MSLLNLEIRPKLNLLLKQFVSTTADKQLNRIHVTLNILSGLTVYMCMFIGNFYLIFF